MTGSPPFDLRRRVQHGIVEQVAPNIRRLTAGNEGAHTFTGTNTYVIGAGEVAVIDPGPLDEEHVERLCAELGDDTVSHILVTHTHRDHSPAARLLKQRTGAPVLGFGPHSPAPPGSANATLDTGHDPDFAADATLAHGDAVSGAGWSLEAVHTPGHTSNHLSFALAGTGALFSGDHVMGWSTTMVAPPDGDMGAYLDSLRVLMARDDTVYWPGHGGEITIPQRYVRALLQHREAREAAIHTCLGDGLTTVEEIVARIYAGLDPRLQRAAQLTTLSHLIHLVESGRAKTADQLTLDAQFQPR